MEGGSVSVLLRFCGDAHRNTVFKSPETVGMIPRAVDQVFQVTEELKSKGWEYTLEGQFLEIVRISLCP